MSESNPIADLQALEKEALAAVKSAQDRESLEAVRVMYLGRSEGRLSAILRGLPHVPVKRRPEVGKSANAVKERVSSALEARQLELVAPSAESELDLTMPGRSRWRGGLHPITQAVDEIWHIFRDLGFARARGPEADTVWYNFEALNTPLDHPAADEQDTLYLVDSVLLRSHTSPVQMRTMEANEPPIRIIAPGELSERGLEIDEGDPFIDHQPLNLHERWSVGLSLIHI